MKKQEIVTISIVIGVVVAAIYFINKTANGLNNAVQSVGTGAEIGGAAIGVGAGTGIAAWLGQNLWLGLLGAAA